MWIFLTQNTNLLEEKWAIAENLNLTGKAKLASSELSVPEFSLVDGNQLLIRKLDQVFQQDDK